MKYYTLDDVMELKPCHSREKLEEYMKGRKRISLSGILSSKASDDDKIWLVTRLLPVDAAADAIWAARDAADAAADDDTYAVRDVAYNKARKNQINQLKLIVKENKL